MTEFASGVYGKLFDDKSGFVYKVFFTENKANEAGWIREIIALKNISHPNIISPKFIGYDFTADPNVKPKPNLYIKLKKYGQLLNIKTLLCDLDILQALLDLFNGIAYMHSKFMMHRDIKEANLLFEPSKDKNRVIEKLVICDFSLARFTINTDDIKHFNYLTPETVTSSHRAPEVFQSIRSNDEKGLRKCKIEYNEKVDVWSAGIVMFFLLTGLQLYHAIFIFERKNSDFLDFIKRTPKLQNIGNHWRPEDCEKIYTELMLSDYAEFFVQSLVSKYINKNLIHLEFYKKLFKLCISDAEVRPSAVEVTTIISKYILEHDLTVDIIDNGFLGQIVPSYTMKSHDIVKKIQSFMNDSMVRIMSPNIKSLILNKIVMIIDKFCSNSNVQLSDINTKYIIAVAHIVEIMYLYECIFTCHFRSNQNEIYRFIKEIFIQTDFLEGLF